MFLPWTLTSARGGSATVLTYCPMGLSDFKGLVLYAKAVDPLVPDFGKPHEGMKFRGTVLCKFPVITHFLDSNCA